MKILYLCFDPSIDLAGETGGAVHIRALIRALTELGHEVMTICTCASRRLWVESQVGAGVLSRLPFYEAGTCVKLAKYCAFNRQVPGWEKKVKGMLDEGTRVLGN